MKFLDPKAVKFGSESVEVELLRTCSHPNVIALEEVLHIEGRRAKTALVFPAFDLDLRRLLRLRRGFPLDFPNEHRLQIARGIWVGVAYLHSRQILHRDIKPANILIRFGSKVHTVLADMGLATNMSMPSVFAGRDAEINKNHTACVCTDGYVAPELLLVRAHDRTSYGFAIDVWSAAVVSFEIASLQHFVVFVVSMRSVFFVHWRRM